MSSENMKFSLKEWKSWKKKRIQDVYQDIYEDVYHDIEMKKYGYDVQT